MIKNIPLVISGSARKEGDTNYFVDFLLEGIDHKIIELHEYTIAPFNYEASYPSDDAFLKICADLLAHDKLIFATPVYWYSMSGVMKTFFDRFTDLVTIKKQIGRELKGKSTFLIAVGTGERLPDGFELPFKLTSDYLEMTFKTAAYFSSKHNKEQRMNVKNNFIAALNGT
jgi:multimeric flavodoxin WrbA